MSPGAIKTHVVLWAWGRLLAAFHVVFTIHYAVTAVKKLYQVLRPYQALAVSVTAKVEMDRRVARARRARACANHASIASTVSGNV